jgi:hypothetical protein
MVGSAAAPQLQPVEPAKSIDTVRTVDTIRTVRELLPWHEVERKLRTPRSSGVDAQEAEVPAPSSGVRVSDSGISIKSSNTNDTEGALSYRVYTVAELDRIAVPAMRASMLSLSLSSRPAPSLLWKSAGRSLYTLLDAVAGWLVHRGHKPALASAVAHPLAAFRADARSAVASIDWKKAGIGLGAGVGAMAALLAIVLVVADLTDEMKPARAMTSPATATATVAPGEAVTTTSVDVTPVATTAAPVVAATPPTTFEIGDEPAPAPARPAKKAKKGKKAPVEDFIP